jgi:hypothetical protein
MLISTALLLDSIIRNSVCTPAKLPCRRVEVGYEVPTVFLSSFLRIIIKHHLLFPFFLISRRIYLLLRRVNIFSNIYVKQSMSGQSLHQLHNEVLGLNTLLCKCFYGNDREEFVTDGHLLPLIIIVAKLSRLYHSFFIN